MWHAWLLLLLGRLSHLVMCIDCPDADPCHNTGNENFICSHTMAECVDRRCVCTEKDYNLCTCLPNVAGCSIQYQSPKAVAIPDYGDIIQPTYSCTPSFLNPDYNFHVISNYEGNGNSGYKVHSSGFTNVYIEVTNEDYRPIVLMLTSYEPVRWQLSISPRDAIIDRVLLVSYYLRQSTVYHSEQVAKIEKYLSTEIPRGYGDDAGGGNTVGLLYYVQHYYGTVASFTGSYRADRWDIKINGTEINEIPGSYITPVSGDFNQDRLSVRLAGRTNSATEGRVEVFYNGAWGTVCDEQWDINDANVVCHQLGYGYAIRPSVGAEFGTGTGVIVLNDVDCKGNEETLFDCPLNSRQPYGEYNCGHNQDAGVMCQGDSNNPENSSLFIVRLVGANSRYEGRVEVRYKETWGTICDDEWDIDDATVVCRQLGFGQAIRPSVSAEFGEGSGIIVLDNVECTGNEVNLYHCPLNPRQPLGKTNCKHSEDAGVVCQGESSSGSSLRFLIGPITFFLIVSLLCLATCCLCKVCRTAMQRRRSAASRSVQYTNGNNEYQYLAENDPNRAPIRADDLPPSYDAVLRNSAAYPRTGESVQVVTPVPSTPPPSYTSPKPGEAPNAFTFEANETANV